MDLSLREEKSRHSSFSPRRADGQPDWLSASLWVGELSLPLAFLFAVDEDDPIDGSIGECHLSKLMKLNTQTHFCLFEECLPCCRGIKEICSCCQTKLNGLFYRATSGRSVRDRITPIQNDSFWISVVPRQRFGSFDHFPQLVLKFHTKAKSNAPNRRIIQRFPKLPHTAVMKT
jgi:hypothetical protein